MPSTPRSAKARNLGSIRALPPPFLPSNGAGNSRDLIFTRRASDDLREIGDWTAQHFGHAAASDYLSRLEQACGKLLIDPLRAPAYPYARAIYRVLRFRSHRVFFRIEDDKLIIVRILHAAQDPKRRRT